MDGKISPKYVLDAWFESDINNLKEVIPIDLKKSFKNQKIQYLTLKGFRAYYMYTDIGERLNSSYEINFYFLLKKNKIDYIHERKYPNSNMRYDFYLKKYNLYIEIAGMMCDEDYKNKMVKKHKLFDAVILKSEKEQENFIENLLNGKYKKKQIDIHSLFS